MPPKLFYQFISFINYRRLGFKWYKQDLKSPRTFTEKINYLKLYYRNPLAPVVADKVKVRKYVSERIGDKYLIPVIGIFNDCSQIDYEQLPSQFALKTNHGSGWNLICKDKSKVDWKLESKKLDKWLKKDAYYLCREWQYKKINTMLICEKLLQYEIKDYKLFCFNGIPKLIQVDEGRFSSHKRTIFDLNWDEQPIQILYPPLDKKPVAPKKLDEMVFLAKKLSNPFVFCRVDFYEHDDDVYFGEITMHPGGGMEPFQNYEQDLLMGKLMPEYLIL